MRKYTDLATCEFIKVVGYGDTPVLPTRATEGSAGYDISACTDIIVGSKRVVAVPTGWKIALPHGYEAQIRSRSGLAIKEGIFVANSPGTIDEDYRGELMVLLYNSRDNDFYVEPGMRIAQMVLAPVVTLPFKVVTEFSTGTARGEGGFGSTGV